MTDRRTDRHTMTAKYRTSIASRGKKTVCGQKHVPQFNQHRLLDFNTAF